MKNILFLLLTLSLTATYAGILDNLGDKAVDGIADYYTKQNGNNSSNSNNTSQTNTQQYANNNSKKTNRSNRPKIVNEYQKQCLKYSNCRLIGANELPQREGIEVSEDMTYCELSNEKRIRLCWHIIRQLKNKSAPQTSGFLAVNSSPQGAKIYINNALIGVTPYEDYEIPEGRYQIKVIYKDPNSHSIYPEQTKQVVIDELSPKTMSFSFDKRGKSRGSFGGSYDEQAIKEYLQLGNILVLSKPNGVIVYINGEQQNNTPFSKKGVEIGRYDIEFKHNEQSLKGEFDIIKDQTVKLIADFNKKAIINVYRQTQIRLKQERKQQAKLEVARKIEAKKQQAERQRQAIFEAKRQQELNRDFRDLAKEEAAGNQARIDKQIEALKADYIYLIQTKVTKNWRHTPLFKPDWTCTVLVQQDTLGKVQVVNVKACNNNSKEFRRSVQSAVRKASPLPLAPIEEVFDEIIDFKFKPQ